MRFAQRLLVLGVLAVFVCAGIAAGAQSQPNKKQRERQRRAFDRELNDPYRKWIEEDVAYIITDPERQAFKRLQNAEERERLVEIFWRLRDPTPDTEENEAREEHYRRIAYANEHFASGVQGWRTDRGRIYIMHGPPDQIEAHPSGGTYERPREDGGGVTTTFPFETWRYRHIADVGDDIVLEFVDASGTGEYRLAFDPSEKDALKHVPGHQPNADVAGGSGALGGSMRSNAFDRLKLHADIQRPPRRFPDLERVATDINVRYNLLPFEFRTDFLRITSETVLSAMTLKLRVQDMTFQNHQGVQRGTVNIFGRVSSMTGQTVSTFEDVVQVDVPAEQLSQSLAQARVYWQALPLRPGKYRLDLVVKDVNSGNTGVTRSALHVPRYDDETLSASTLMIADQIEKVDRADIGKGQFVIGASKVRPNVSQRFRRSQRLGVYMQVYNLALDATTHKPSAAIEYVVLRDDHPVMRLAETTDQIAGASQQLTLSKMLPLAGLTPGRYKLEVRVTDRVGKQAIAPSAMFTVE